MFDRILNFILGDSGDKDDRDIPIVDVKEQPKSTSKGWRRTTAYRNFMNSRRWMPKIDGHIAELQSGRQYKMMHTGWRRIPNTG